MDKSRKFKNFLIDSKGVAHNKEPLNNLLENLIESGSNSNGNYIKYFDGTMICYGSYNFTSDNGDYWTNFYRSDVYTINFPQEYVSKPNLSITVSSDHGAISAVYNSDTDITNKSFRFVQIKSKGIVPGTHKMNYGQWFAIGKWK